MDNSPPFRRKPFWSKARRRLRQTQFTPHDSQTTPSQPNQQALTPIHQLDQVPNPQANSPLYNGVIPPEIRDQIFIYALLPYTKPDPATQYAHDTAFTRPGYSGPKTLTVSLLQTCRRVYHETYHLPPALKEHVFYHHRGPSGPDERAYFARFTPWQLARVREVHLFAQMYWLEDSFMGLCRGDFMRGMEKVVITIRRGDWWWNERNAKLAISPKMRSVQVEGTMEGEWERERRGVEREWEVGAWGLAFKSLPSLKELILELETSEDKIGELKAVVEKAKTWKFPMRDGMVLSSEGLKVDEMAWRSPLCNWSETCPYCGGRMACIGDGEKCKEKGALKAEGKGPMCYVFTLRWKLAQGEALQRRRHSLVSLP